MKSLAFAFAFDHPTPPMRISDGLESKSVTVAINIKPEIPVEFLSDRNIRHAQNELVERMNSPKRRPWRSAECARGSPS